MQIYNVYQSGKRLYIDEKEIPDNKIVVNKYENEVTTLRLVSDGTLPPRLYWALRNPKLSNKYFILKLLNNEDLIVGTDISAYPGLWDMLLIGTDEDYIIEGADIDQSRLTYVSDHFGRLFVRDNFLEELDFEEQCSPTFRIFYDEIMFSLGNKVDTKDIPDKLSDLENDTGFISGVALKDDGEGNVKIVGTTFEGSETEEGGGGNYNLPVANETTLGGVKPLNKTEDMTLDVGVDKNGRLFAKGKDITVDSELDKESQNPVQNKVITAEVIALRERNAELEETIEKLQIKVTTEPSPFHHITDSANMKVVDFGMEGITEQETTSGKNLFDISKVVGYGSYASQVEVLDNCIKIVKPEGYSSSGYTTLTCTLAELCPKLVAGGTYTLSGTFSSTGTLPDGNKRIYVGTTWGFGNALTVTEAMLNSSVTFYASTDEGITTISDIMVNEGTTAQPYEPYTNGPTPNPTHPQDIKLAGVLNEETGRYEHKCCVGNKNFWDAEYASDKNNWFASDRTGYKYTPIFVGIGRTVTISYKNKLDTGLLFYAGIGNGVNYIQKWLYNTDNSSYNKNAITLTAIDDYINIVVNTSSFNLFTQYLGNDLQIEISSSATELLSHASQPLTLTSDRPLTMWDKLVKRDGVWGWSINTIIKTFTGDESFNVEYTSDDGKIAYTTWDGCDKILQSYDVSQKDSLVVCNKFIGVLGIYVSYKSFTQNYVCSARRNNAITFASLSSEGIFESVDTFKEYLKTAGVVLYGKSAIEQAFIPLPDEEQTLLNNLETYYGVTNVYNEQGCPMWLTYIVDNQLYFDNKIEEINNALLSLGANI